MIPVESPPVTLYTRRWCTYCFAARRLLKRLRVPYEEIPLDRRHELRNEISKKAGGWPTVPMIFIGERFVGGYTELADLHRRGELLPAIESAPADRPSSRAVGRV